jgi:hypothetical protein
MTSPPSSSRRISRSQFSSQQPSITISECDSDAQSLEHLDAQVGVGVGVCVF